MADESRSVHASVSESANDDANAMRCDVRERRRLRVEAAAEAAVRARSVLVQVAAVVAVAAQQRDLRLV